MAAKKEDVNAAGEKMASHAEREKAVTLAKQGDAGGVKVMGLKVGGLKVGGIKVGGWMVGWVLVGMLGLMWPGGVVAGTKMSWVDAFFTSCSAVCSVGLSVRTPGAHLSGQGRAILVLLVQMGGIGLVAAAWDGLARWLGRPAMIWSRRLLRVAVGMILIESAGVLALLAMSWMNGGESGWDKWGEKWGGQSIDAFNNSGFWLDGVLEQPVDRMRIWAVYGVFLPLSVLGGMGCLIWESVWEKVVGLVQRLGWGGESKVQKTSLPLEMYQYRTSCVKRWLRMGLGVHCGIYVLITVILWGLWVGLPGFYRARGMDVEMHGKVEAVTWAQAGKELAEASWVSVASRSWGVWPEALEEKVGGRAAQILLLGAMLVGGMPGGTAGGVGVLAVVLVGMTMFKRGRRREDDGSWEPWRPAVIRVLVGWVLLLGGAWFLLSISEPYPQQRLLWEIVSGASGSGLGGGLSTDMTGFGKVVMGLVMLAGRMLTLGLWLAVLEE